MKVTSYIKGLVLILLVLFTITLPSRLSITKFKGPQTFTELDVSDLEVKKVIFPLLAIMPDQIFQISKTITLERKILPPQFEPNFIINPSLQFLYLTHSPPYLA